MYSNCKYNLTMARASITKAQRLQVRLDAHAKSVLQRAADYSRTTVSQFVMTTAVAEAERVVRENEVVTLSDPDWKLFYDALVDPPAPNKALRRAFDRFRKAGE
jgi:uncharacterized protein (DUF1778 family)